MHYAAAKGILLPGNAMNLYRGCTHGCIYCDSRSRCYQINHDFEDVEVKINAPELLDAALARKRSKCIIRTGSMCDHYIPLENELRHTRKCLEIIDRHGFGVAMHTKSASVLRDADLFQRINGKAACILQTTITTADDELCAVLEPEVAVTSGRIRAMKELRRAGIPIVVWLTPILPFINDTEENIRGLLGMCAEIGACGVFWFGAGLTLRDGNREYFYAALDRYFPGLSGEYHKKYGYSYSVQSGNDVELSRIVAEFCEKYGIIHDNNELFRRLSALPSTGEQLSL